MNSKIDHRLLVTCTIEYMIQKNINNFVLSSTNSPRDPKSDWGQICLLYKKEFCFKTSVAIQKRWTRNSDNYATAVLSIIKNRPREDYLSKTQGN